MMLSHHGAPDKLKLFHLEDGGFNHQRDYKIINTTIKPMVGLQERKLHIKKLETRPAEIAAKNDVKAVSLKDLGFEVHDDTRFRKDSW